MTVTGIANKALIDLRESPISDLEEGTVRANAIGRVIESAIDTVLMAFEWSCALYRKELSLDPTAGQRYDYAYYLPSDPYCLKVVKVIEPSTGWMIRGRRIETDADSVTIEYIRRITNEAEISPWIIDAIAKQTAMKAAPLITGDPQIQQRLTAEYQMELLQAKRVEAEQMPDQEGSAWWDERLEETEYKTGWRL